VFDKKTIEKIRSYSAAIEKAGKLPEFILNLIYKEKLFKLFVPKESNGLMMPLPDALRIFDEASRIDGNMGWAITIGSGGGYFYAYMQNKTAHEVFKDSKAVVAGSGHLSAIAEEVNRGYKVTGQWKYASGAPYATIFTANAMIKSKKKDAPKMLAFTFLTKQVGIIKDWNAFGMKATESYSFKVSKAFVPHNMTFDLSAKKLNYEHLFYHYPFLQFAETSFAAVVIGLGRHFMEEAGTILEHNKIGWSKAVPNRYNLIKKKIEAREKLLKTSIEAFYKLVDKSWAQLIKNHKLETKLQVELSKTSRQTSRVVLACADEIFQYMGMEAVMENSTINRIYRDLHTACQHVLLIPLE
jgi:alkylation response protein AidB-like acyl-CoA dehydrogenase